MVEEIIRYYGSAYKAAKALGFSKQGVYKWRERGISEPSAYKIEVQSNGRFKAKEIIAAQSGQKGTQDVA